MKLEVFAIDEWAPAVGARLVARVSSADELRLCLATGRTPAPAYAEFAASGGTLEHTEVFLLDEFLLPAGDPGRCDEMLRRTLLNRLSRPPAIIHTFNMDAGSLDTEAARFAALVAAGGLDLAIVGLGRNGHIGMNEPGSGAEADTRVVELHSSTQQNAAGYGATTPPKFGITVGMRTLLAAREIWLLVTGGQKAEILKQAIAGPVGSDVPASYLQLHDNAIVYADEPAAKLLG